MRGLLILAIVALLATSVTAAGAADSDVLNTLELGMAWVEPFDNEVNGFAAFDLSLTPLQGLEPEALTLRSLPQSLLANVAFDLLVIPSTNDIDLGMSLPLVAIDTGVPFRLGISRSDVGWCWFVKGGVAF